MRSPWTMEISGPRLDDSLPTHRPWPQDGESLDRCSVRSRASNTREIGGMGGAIALGVDRCWCPGARTTRRWRRRGFGAPGRKTARCAMWAGGWLTAVSRRGSTATLREALHMHQDCTLSEGLGQVQRYCMELTGHEAWDSCLAYMERTRASSFYPQSSIRHCYDGCRPPW
jgi:hypothetical protein